MQDVDVSEIPMEFVERPSALLFYALHLPAFSAQCTSNSWCRVFASVGS